MGAFTGLVEAKSKQSRQMLPHCSMGSRLAAVRHCSTVMSVSLLSGTSPVSAPAMTDFLSNGCWGFAFWYHSRQTGATAESAAAHSRQPRQLHSFAVFPVIMFTKVIS